MPQGGEAALPLEPTQAAPLTEDIALLDEALAARAAAPRASFRDAAAGILAARDDQAARFGTHDGDLIGTLDAPMAALRTLLAGKPARGARESSTSRKPREDTKQEQVLAMLRRPKGATVAQIAEATGWTQHAVRGFFAGRKRGATRFKRGRASGWMVRTRPARRAPSPFTTCRPDHGARHGEGPPPDGSGPLLVITITCGGRSPSCLS